MEKGREVCNADFGRRARVLHLPVPIEESTPGPAAGLTQSITLPSWRCEPAIFLRSTHCCTVYLLHRPMVSRPWPRPALNFATAGPKHGLKTR